MKNGMPLATHGLRVGLLGGSFDPPHSGHLHISKWAMKEFNLDRVWWLVSPGNPLKNDMPADLDRRMSACKELVNHPNIIVTDIECRLGTRFTAQTIAGLQSRYPGVRFIWLMGADNLAQFHRWQDWQWIMESVPVGVVARPSDRGSARLSKAATIYRGAMLPARASSSLANGPAPRWCFINLPMSDHSSTIIRQQGGWG